MQVGDIEVIKPPRHRRWLWVVLCAVGLSVLALAAGTAWYLHQRDPNQLLIAGAQNKAAFTLYYPSNLPSRYYIDASSIQTTNKTVIFPVTRTDGEKIVVTEQSLPVGFDSSNITGVVSNIPDLGRVVAGTGFIGYRAVITANQTLILVSSTQKITPADFNSIVKSFRRV